jgi:hypothetical protein
MCHGHGLGDVHNWQTVSILPQVTSNDFVLDPRFRDIAPVGFNAGGIEAEQKGILIVKMRRNQVRSSWRPCSGAAARGL